MSVGVIGNATNNAGLVETKTHLSDSDSRVQLSSQAAVTTD